MTPGFPAADALSQGWGALLLRGAIGAVLAVLVILMTMAWWPRRLMGAAEWSARRLPARVAGPMVRSMGTFLDAIAIMRDPKLLFLGFAWTVFFWGFHGVSFWLGMLAFGIDTGFVSAIFVEAVVGFGVALPAAPGFIGTFHASAKFALSDVYGVPEPQSLAFAFGYHFGGWIPITAIGLWYAWKLGLSLSEVGAAEERVERHPDAAHEGGRIEAEAPPTPGDSEALKEP
jgi:hypothetical protein